jgi:hypothetical protein
MLCVTNDNLLCGNADKQQDQRSVIIQADEPPGFVDKEKSWRTAEDFCTVRMTADVVGR